MDAQFVNSLEDTLKQTLISDSSVIKEASQKLSKDFYPDPKALPSLLQILQQSNQDEIKLLAAVEARKLALDNWEGVNASLKPSIRESLLKNTFAEQNKRLRNASARVIAAIAEVDLEANEWTDLLPNLISAIQSNDVQTKEVAAFTLLAMLESQLTALLPHIDDFITLYGNLIHDTSSKEIRVNSVLALDVLSQLIEDTDEAEPAVYEKFKATIPGMVEVLKEVVASDDTESAKQVFNVFNGLVLIDTALVGDHLINLIKMICEMVTNTSLDEDYRIFGLQFLISCVSYRKTKITSNKLGPQVTMVGLKVASEEIDVEDELENEDEENENEESSPSSLALRLLAILAAELPPSQVITPLFEALPPLLTSSNQFERRAALLSIGVCSAGAPDYIASQIQKIIPALINGLKDPEIIVRVAALRTLSQLTSELQDIVTDHHEQLLPLIIEIIDSASSIMAYKYACYALDGLIEFMSHDAMNKYIEPLMHKLFHMLSQANSSTLKTAIVSAIGSTAFASGKGFTPFFQGSIQQLEPFITNSASVDGMSEDDIELRATTFENISTMARAVGSQTFSMYAKPLVEAAYNSLSSEHSRIRESGFAFIANMAKVYGPEFAGFLDQIVPQILSCLDQEEFTFNVDAVEGEGEELEEVDEEAENDDPLKVHTGITIEKEIASVALGELAIGTGKEFFKYVEPSITALAEQVANSFGMREAAMNCLFKIVKAMFVAVQGKDFKPPKGVPKSSYVDSSILELIKQVRDLAIPLLEEEFESTMVACILDGTSNSLHTFGSIFIVDSPNDTSSLEKLCFSLMNILKKDHPCQLEDDEFPEEEDSSETEVLLNESALEVLINLSIALEGDFVKIFTSFKDLILSKFDSKSKPLKVGSIGAIAEMVGGMKSSNPYSQELLQVFLQKFSTDKSIEVKGNAAYGIGLIVEYSPIDLTSSYPQILELLFHLLNKVDKKAGNADDEEAKDVVNRAYANACGCVARLILKNQQAVPLEHVIEPLLDHLPLETGLEENTPVFEAIIKLYESNNQNIISQTPKVVEIFAGVFKAEEERIKLINESTLGREENIDSMKQFSSDELKHKVIELLKFLNQKYDGVVSHNEILKSVIS
ncbi:kap123 [Candida pseudojiufengensis]|uniref:kap123 n=1 Tax=Candida pseudojiufengensis TaxID=497109 RepID=UPI0022253D47|nr:kap123 [Candida pseudojiufengensis]KAI5960399.1 kap123 [Candida pseudojiufengensis]